MKRLKTLLIAFLLFCMPGFANVPRQNLRPIFAQSYLGTSNVFRGVNGHITSIQTGGALIPSKTIVFLSLENDYSYSLKTYHWPGLGSYSIQRTCNNTGMGVGLFFLRRKAFNIASGIRAYIYFQNGRIKTKNDRIAESVAPNYSYSHFDASVFLRLNYRIHKHASIYAGFNKFRSEERERFADTVRSRLLWEGNNVISIGIAYNFYDRRKP